MSFVLKKINKRTTKVKQYDSCKREKAKNVVNSFPSRALFSFIIVLQISLHFSKRSPILYQFFLEHKENAQTTTITGLKQSLVPCVDLDLLASEIVIFIQ